MYGKEMGSNKKCARSESSLINVTSQEIIRIKISFVEWHHTENELAKDVSG